MQYRIEKRLRKRRLLIERIDFGEKELGENEYELTIIRGKSKANFVVEIESVSFLKEEQNPILNDFYYRRYISENKHEVRLRIVNASFETTCRISEILVDIFRLQECRQPIDLIFKNSFRTIYLFGACTKSLTTTLGDCHEQLCVLEIELC